MGGGEEGEVKWLFGYNFAIKIFFLEIRGVFTDNFQTLALKLLLIFYPETKNKNIMTESIYWQWKVFVKHKAKLSRSKTNFVKVTSLYVGFKRGKKSKGNHPDYYFYPPKGKVRYGILFPSIPREFWWSW